MTNEEFNEIFRKRTLLFSINVLNFLETIPFNSATRIFTFQLGKAASSVGANFRAFCRGRSRNERFAKRCIVVEEADEAIYWFEIIAGTKYADKVILANLAAEGLEILKVTASIKNSMFPN